MDPLTGALLAAVIGWLSVIAAIALPLERWIPVEHMRRVGGITLGLLAASLLGARLPVWLPFAFLAGGFAVSVWATRARRGPREGNP